MTTSAEQENIIRHGFDFGKGEWKLGKMTVDGRYVYGIYAHEQVQSLPEQRSYSLRPSSHIPFVCVLSLKGKRSRL